MLPITRDLEPSTPPDLCHMLTVSRHGLPASSPDLSHVLTVHRYARTALAAGLRMTARIAVPAPTTRLMLPI